jgi:Flp pilus assembly protein TadG
MLCALAVPPLILFCGLSIDQSYVYYRNQVLKRTAQAAALAAQTNLNAYYAYGGTTYSTASMASINSAVQMIVSANMPAAQYGTVVPVTSSNSTSAVQLGTWSNASKAFTATITNPNAVQVTALNTVANGNPVNTFFRGMIGLATVDLSTAAVASYGNGLSGAGGFNTIILNDLSMSFSSEVSNQRTADIAILNCVAGGSNGNAKVGLTGFTGHSKTVYALTQSTAPNVSTMTTYIHATLDYCGNTGMPACSGSNVASGLYSAIAQLAAAGIANTSSNIILITDGVPNADAMTYAAVDGTSTTPIAKPTGWSGCTGWPANSSCSDANLWTAAQAQSLYAKSLGISISTVYYSGDTVGATNIANYSAKLASLVTGNGVSLVAPSASSINSAFATFCTSMGSAVKRTQ